MHHTVQIRDFCTPILQVYINKNRWAIICETMSRYNQYEKRLTLDDNRPVMDVISMEDCRRCRLLYLLRHSYYVAILLDTGVEIEDAVDDIDEIISGEVVAMRSKSDGVYLHGNTSGTNFIRTTIDGSASNHSNYIIFGPDVFRGKWISTDVLHDMIQTVTKPSTEASSNNELLDALFDAETQLKEGDEVRGSFGIGLTSTSRIALSFAVSIGINLLLRGDV
jgi:hypothetical protein